MYEISELSIQENVTFYEKVTLLLERGRNDQSKRIPKTPNPKCFLISMNI